MQPGSEPHARAFDRKLAAKAGVAVGILVLVAAILAPRTLTPPAATPGATSAAIGASGAPATGTPDASAEPWADLTVPAYQPVAELIPDDHDRIGIATTTSFTLRSLTTTPAVELARGLTIDPPTKLAVEAGASPDLARVHPTDKLLAGQRYRIRLQATDGSLAGTWAYIARAPLHVVGTLPGNLSVQVPTNTGIEITFDQDGVTANADQFAINPAVAGRFESHGRVWAFVPSKPLVAGAIYAVTIKKGIGLTGSTEILEHDVTFRFETDLGTANQAHVGFTRSMVEVRPDTAATVTVDAGTTDDDSGPAVTKVGILIHRLPDYKAVVAAGIALAGPNAWALAAPSATVSTSGLTKVAELDVAIVASTIGSILNIPVKLARGAYVVTIKQPGPPAQVLLQVTNLSAYVLTSTKTTVAWVNDLSSNAAVAGAAVSIADGTTLGATGADGVLSVQSPAKLQPTPNADSSEDVAPAARFVTISAAGLGSLLVPIGLPVPYGYAGEAGSGYGASDWWLLFNTDRQTYRQTDTAHVFGVIRARSDRAVPTGLELRLLTVDGSPDAPIERVPVVATSRGVFSADVKLDNLPIAAYTIDLVVGNQVVSTAWFNVAQISKPAYQLDLRTNHHVYLLGDTITVTATASFFDGTVVPGMDLAFAGLDQQATATTDALGQATVTLKATSSSSDVPEGWSQDEVAAAPVRPEEGQINGVTGPIVVPSRVRINGTGAIAGGNVVVTGRLNWFDVAALEAARAKGQDLEDPSGPAIAGGVVRAQIVHIVEKREQVGTAYDFIEKKVVPQYEYTEEHVTVGTQTAKSAADGTFRISVPAQYPKDSYFVVLSSADPEGRKIQLTVNADAPIPPRDQLGQAYLQVPGGCGIPSLQAGLNEPVTLTMYRGDGTVAPAGHFLFLVSELGSLVTTVQDAAAFTRTLRDADLPGFTARAVWLSSAGYRVADVRVDVDLKDKTLKVRLQPDHKAYQPGDPVTIGVTTTDPSGHPVAADVVVQGVDQKLFAIGAAFDSEPVGALMSSVAPGFVGSYVSHDVPSAGPDGCGDTGGDDRGDFRDTITFQRTRTDASGHGSVAFKLSDDLTSWHITATAVSAALDAGQASVPILVGLPFFVDAVLAPEYLVGDQPILRLRGYGAGLATGDHVRFVVSAPSLGLSPTTVEGNAFEALRLPLPTMTAGDHAIRIEASGTHAGTALRDVLIRTVHVTDSRIGTVAASYDALGADFRPQGGPGLTTYVITDAGRGRLVPLLRELASSTSARFDRTAAAELARELLIQEFSVPAESLATTGFDATRYQSGSGIALLPYASGDLFLAARAALVVGSKLEADTLRGTFEVEFDGSNPSTPERQIAALAGLAGIGQDVLERLRTYNAADLPVREQLWLALGFAAAGDEATARSIERTILEANGQRLGPWVRLGVGTSLTDSLEASGLLLLLTGRLGDPIANDVSRYLVDHPSTEQVFPLEQLGYVQGMLDRLPKAAGKLAWTVAGERHAVTLEAGGAFSLVLTASQRATLRLEPLAGDLAVATTWLASGGELPSDPSMTIARTVDPAGSASDSRLVHIKITVTFGAQAPGGCYRLTDLLPSGLAPVVKGASWPGAEGDDTEPVIGPYDIEGQRVSWCISPADRSHVYGYAARVVTPGTYRWEPAIVQSEIAPTLGASTAATTYAIR